MVDFKPQNNVKIVGEVVEHDLKIDEFTKKDGSGDKYNACLGKVVVKITDDNITTLRYFQQEFWKAGKPEQKNNPNFDLLKKWSEAKPEKVLDDKGEETGEERTEGIGDLIEVTTGFGANAFVNPQGELIENSDVQGSFTKVLKTPVPSKSEFNTEVFIKNTPVEITDDEGETTHWEIVGNAFDFRNVMFPVNFTIKSEQAADFFTEAVEDAEGKGIFIKIWGDVINSEIIYETKEPNAFGEELIVENVRYRKENIITGATPAFKPLNEEDNKFIIEEVKKGRAAYETYLAQVKDKNNGGNAIGSGAESKKESSSKKTAPKDEYEF